MERKASGHRLAKEGSQETVTPYPFHPPTPLYPGFINLIAKDGSLALLSFWSCCDDHIRYNDREGGWWQIESGRGEEGMGEETRRDDQTL
jgi:hypothetical protein